MMSRRSSLACDAQPRRTGNRACMVCSKKKIKCDMTLPTCAQCMKVGSVCQYPTSRKPRPPRPRKPAHPQQELKDRVDFIFNLLSAKSDAEKSERRGQDDRESQQSTSTTNDTGAFDPPQGNMDDLADSTETGPSHNLAVEQMSPGRQILSANLEDPGLFGAFSPSLLGADTSSEAWLTTNTSLDDIAAAGDWMQFNPDSFSLVSSYQPIGSPDLGFSKPSSSLNTNGTAATTGLAERLSDGYELGVTPQLVDELIEIYFERIHSFLPLFHKPRFLENYVLSNQSSDRRYQSLSLENSFILNGILALSARFSTSPYFDGISPVQRGEPFRDQAKVAYGDFIRLLQKPTLQYLQGCILLAFYLYSCEPDSQGWLLIGACSRLAYDLGLDKVDEARDEQSQTVSGKEWSQREELRRAWWCVWELDTFASAISCRPPTIDRKKMSVCIPVSDETWFADMPMDSAIIDPDPLRAWHTLRDCPNQDERAWFLLINYLLLIAHDLGQQKSPTRQKIADIESAVACYALLLPPQFQLSSGSLTFNSQNFKKSNWIISTNMMLQGCRSFIRFLSDSASANISLSSTNLLLAPLAAGSQFGARKMDYRPYADQVFQTIRTWCPEYIPYNSPFIGCLILGPAAINLRVAKDLTRMIYAESDSLGIEGELLMLALKHIARFWKIGSVILDIANQVADSLTP